MALTTWLTRVALPILSRSASQPAIGSVRPPLHPRCDCYLPRRTFCIIGCICLHPARLMRRASPSCSSSNTKLCSTYWQPRSEWCSNPGDGFRRVTASRQAAITRSAAKVGAQAQPTTRRLNGTGHSRLPQCPSRPNHSPQGADPLRLGPARGRQKPPARSIHRQGAGPFHGARTESELLQDRVRNRVYVRTPAASPEKSSAGLRSGCAGSRAFGRVRSSVPGLISARDAGRSCKLKPY